MAQSQFLVTEAASALVSKGGIKETAMPVNQKLLTPHGKPQSIHELDRNRLDPSNPDSVDPANTDSANEAEDAEKVVPEPARSVVINPDLNRKK